MIYLIDDKIGRQKGFGWNQDKFDKYKEQIKPIYTYADIKEIKSENILNKENVVIYHNSFFDNPVNNKTDESLHLNNRLTKYAEENKMSLVFFSGSIGERRIDDTIATIPVNVLYKNLE